MEIKSIRQASRIMNIAFKISMKSIDKTDNRRAETRATAKHLIGAVENYMLLEKVKFSTET